MADDPKRRLGRGLSALLGDEEMDHASLDQALVSRTIPVEDLTPGKFQPRQRFDESDLASLADSIREKGILQPIVVRRFAGEGAEYEIIAGERRWRAAQLAQLHEVPVLVRDLSDQDALEIALIENLQRENLNPIEEALAYQRLMDEFTHTQDVLSKTVGRSRSHVANTLRLLTLPDPVRDLVADGSLSAGHARTLIGAKDPEAVAREIVAKGLSVRQAEQLSQTEKPNRKPRKPRIEKDPDTLSLERDLSSALGLSVTIRPKAPGGRAGTLAIEYRSLDQLDDVLQRLGRTGIPADRAYSIQGDDDDDVGIPEEPRTLKHTF